MQPALVGAGGLQVAVLVRAGYRHPWRAPPGRSRRRRRSHHARQDRAAAVGRAADARRGLRHRLAHVGANSAGSVFGKGCPVVGAPGLGRGEQVRAPMRARLLRVAGRGSRCSRALRPGAPAASCLWRGLMRRPLRIQDRRCRQRDVGGHLDAHRAVGLHRHVAEDFAHEVGGAEGGVAKVERRRSGIDTAFSMRRKRAGRWSAVVYAGFVTVAMLRVGGVDAVDVVDAADVEDADTLVDQVLSPGHARYLVEDHRRQRARLRRTTSVIITPSTGGMTGMQGVRGPDRTSRCCTAAAPAASPGSARRSGVHGTIGGVVVVQHPAQGPAHQDAIGAIPQRIPELKRPPGDGPRDRSAPDCWSPASAPGRTVRRRCRQRRLGVLDVVGGVDDDEVAAEVRRSR